ncbi:MAG: ATP-binding protein [Propioniciclava sp.]
MTWRIRDFSSDDLDGVLQLWLAVTAEGFESVYALSEVLASCHGDVAVVAVDADGVVGVAVAREAHEQAWVVFHGVIPRRRHQGIGSALLAALQSRLAGGPASRISAVVPAGSDITKAYRNTGYRELGQLRYFEREIPVNRDEAQALALLGGRLLPRDLWDAVGGMATEKEVLERRLVLPLAEPELADQFGVAPPRAVMLFGPPGTGKTTFAKAVASRLEWAFVEVFPSRLASEPGGLAAALRDTFTQIEKLQHAVVFIDEVEEIASHRRGDPPSPTQGVTNELLKLIPAFRERPDRLLVCATNFIRSVDAAFLRHGRFDHVIPIGLPDGEARRAMWARKVPSVSRAGVDLAALVGASDGFTPADIEFAARAASQSALEESLEGASVPEADAGPQTRHYLDAISNTRRTVSQATVEEFLADIDTIARL